MMSPCFFGCVEARFLLSRGNVHCADWCLVFKISLTLPTWEQDLGPVPIWLWCAICVFLRKWLCIDIIATDCAASRSLATQLRSRPTSLSIWCVCGSDELSTCPSVHLRGQPILEDRGKKTCICQKYVAVCRRPVSAPPPVHEWMDGRAGQGHTRHTTHGDTRVCVFACLLAGAVRSLGW